MTTYQPAGFSLATRRHARVKTVGEFAQLPDFSFSLWDWALGHETCPLADGTDPTLCHDFASHMGPVNSNHFMPQAGRAYAGYHALALARARDCRALSEALRPSGGRFVEVVLACEREALTLEAIGQHFLQDAWSMGHMWERWGSTALADFPGVTAVEKRDRAVLVALVSGFVHGARGVLQALPEWKTYDVNDAMCAPWPTVRFSSSPGVLQQGVGDDYAKLLFPPQGPTAFTTQQTQLLSCATSGLLEVYGQTAQAHGATTPPAAGLTTVDPTGPTCFTQRATNEAMIEGMAIQLRVLGLQQTVPLDARFSSWLIPQVARAAGKTPVDRKLRNEFRHSLQRVVTMARLQAKDAPQGTELASGGLGDFLGVEPNGHYPGPAPFDEPALPWGAADARAAAVARVFHLAHAADWCAADDVEALKAHAADGTLDAEGHATACAACAEFAARHLRVGAPGSYDPALEPLCHYLAPDTALVYQPASAGLGLKALAAKWCGCP